MGTLSRDTFSQPRKSKKIGQFAMSGGFAFESLCFQFTRCSYMTFFSSFVRTKLSYCVSIVKTTGCVQRLFHYSWRQNGKTPAVKNPRIRKLNWVRLNWPPPNRHLWLLDSTDYSYRHWFLLCLVFANQCKLFFSIVQDSALHLSCIPCPRVTQGCRKPISLMSSGMCSVVAWHSHNELQYSRRIIHQSCFSFRSPHFYLPFSFLAWGDPTYLS